MPNIADLMLNQRIDELADLERSIASYPEYGESEAEWLAQTIARRDHLRPICLRGLKRCYPAMTEAEREAMLEHALMFRDRPRTGSLGGGYVLVGSR